MNEYMKEFVMGPFVAEEIDLDYEFDAAWFYDFTRPETHLEAREAERWFESASSYPPSRFVFNNQTAEAGPKAKTKSPVKSTLERSSTLMKPTASHLAKQTKVTKPREVHSKRFLRRFQKKLEHIDEKSSGTSSVIDSQATKRQKLGAGYLRKVAHLKHQALLLHKVPKKVGNIGVNSVHTRPEVTILREPDLATARRAQRHRSKINTESLEHVKSNAYTFKARPLNRKILEAPSLPLPKRSIPQLRDFQVFHLKTSERAMQHTANNTGNIYNSNSLSHNEITDGKSLNSTDALNQNCKTVNKFKACPLYRKILSSKGEFDVFQNSKQEAGFPRKFNFSTYTMPPDKPPIELFSKLSLTSDARYNWKSQSRIPLPTKVSKENTPGPFHQAHKEPGQLPSLRA